MAALIIIHPTIWQKGKLVPECDILLLNACTHSFLPQNQLKLLWIWTWSSWYVASVIKQIIQNTCNLASISGFKLFMFKATKNYFLETDSRSLSPFPRLVARFKRQPGLSAYDEKMLMIRWLIRKAQRKTPRLCINNWQLTGWRLCTLDTSSFQLVI